MRKIVGIVAAQAQKISRAQLAVRAVVGDSIGRETMNHTCDSSCSSLPRIIRLCVDPENAPRICLSALEIWSTARNGSFLDMSTTMIYTHQQAAYRDQNSA